MPFMQLTILYFLLSFFAVDQVPTKAAEDTNIILQSKDGGQTWLDISNGLPEMEQRVAFYAGASEVYLGVNGLMYRNKSNLEAPVWEKVNGIDEQSSITFDQSGAVAHTYEGGVYRKDTSSETWLPIYPDLKSCSVQTFFEVSDGTLLRGTGKNFFKSADKALTWKLVQKGWVGDVVESEGVLLATGQKGIIRSTDNGEHWELVIGEGGVGIAIERIDGGFAAISYDAQSESRRVRVSFDSGKTWNAIDQGLPPSSNISSIKQLGNDLFVGHPDGIFRSSDMGKTWHRVREGFGNVLYASKSPSLPTSPGREKVFRIYVSGSVLYAVAVVPGC